ncbi:hypothetical protein [Sorangium sp. So ce861]|uniref:hypothetical protein n=1 Tax=Sorangium sp. So ce861 TaxID=3133323 RepID=UPI003F636F92
MPITDADVFDRRMTVNCKGTFLCMKHESSPPLLTSARRGSPRLHSSPPPRVRCA